MEGLFKIQNELNLKLANAFANYKKSPKARITKSYVDTRLELLEKQWLQFEKNHYELITMDAKLEGSYFKNNLYESVETIYLEYKVMLKDQLESFNQDTNIGSGQNAISSEVKLPKIVLPMFSGNYTEWQSFHDLFESLIHKNLTLANVQKLHYLKTHLSGEPEQLLRNIAITDTNYESCWEQLKKRYNNKRHIANCILSRLTAQKAVSVESSSGIKCILDTTSECLNALNNIGIDVSNWDTLVLFIICKKLDLETRRQWEQRISDYTDKFPTLTEFKDFLESRFRALEYLMEPVNNVKIKEKVKVFNVHILCIFCGESHTINFCKKFCNAPYEQRYEFVKKQKLCFNCFGYNHPVFKCKKNIRCNICKRRHHTLLHPTGESGSVVVGDLKNNSTGTQGQQSNDGPSTYNVGTVVSNFCNFPGQVILATAVVKIINEQNNCIYVRALLDQGSQASFVSEHCVQLLGLRKKVVQGSVTGLDGRKSTHIKYAVNFSLQSTVGSFKCDIEAYVLNHLSSNLPYANVNIKQWPELLGLELADPGCGSSSKIDVLLGAEIYAQIIKNGIFKNSSGDLLAQNTELGWMLSGRSELKENPSKIISLHIQDEHLSNVIRQFWEVEHDQPVRMLTKEEEYCEEFYESTTKRDKSGRYIVRLPFRDEDPQCQYGQFKEVALRRLKMLEKRLSKSTTLKEQYHKAMMDYIDQGHLEEIKDPEKLTQINCVYLPHHAVVREDKTTTKVRVVFDASCKGKNDVSLNEDLLIGPRLQPELRHLLLRWRNYPVCFVADIVQMYRQVMVGGEDALKYQRLLWRLKGDEVVKEFVMTRVTFGISSSPYLAVKSLQKLGKDEGNNNEYKTVAERILKDFYMDDLLSGCEDENEAVEIYEKMNTLMAKGGFRLQKWTSNSNKLRKIAEEKREIKEIDSKIDGIVKTLGLCWNVDSDSFQYNVNLSETKLPVTKRKMLADIARLFDPLGWTAPVIVKAKLFIQKLWLAGFSWDEEINGGLLTEWLTFREDLSNLNKISLPRWTHINKDVKNITLHGFCDASNAAYAAVVYSRVIDEEGVVHVTLLAARTKVAPLKQISIPKLELSGAELLANLLSEIATEIGYHRSQLRAWTDSTIVLAWLKGEPSRWKTFVANRVTKILSVLDNDQWGHVESIQNPADCASRGLNPSDFLKDDLWVHGPSWLRDSILPVSRPVVPETDLESKIIKVHVSIKNKEENKEHLPVWTKYSSLQKLVRVVAWCKRFILKKKDKIKGLPTYLTVDELNNSLKCCLRFCQQSTFVDEFESLKTSKVISRRSRLRSLCPFIDEDNLMRVRGRIQNSDEEYEKKHPIILPAHHHISTLIVVNAHKETLHGGYQLTLNFIRSTYWILNVKSMVKQVIRKCGKCSRFRTTANQPFMGNLPRARVTMSRPFSHCGVDYAGPISIRLSKGRGCRSYKGYICLFVCMSTRAIHLEAVSDLTTEGFLSAFKRFVARRGHCSEIFSDNGTNFVGAAKELQKLFKDNVLGEVAGLLANKGTKWSFIPPHSPNFGGLWEAGVKSTKYHLRRILNGTTLTYEELSTVLTQIEACLNSRPLCQVTSDNETIPLTPGHFLIGEPVVMAPDYNYENCNVSNLRRWQFTQRLVQQFWRRWSQEYLTTLVQRYKWNRVTPEPKCGDVVLIKEDDLPPSKWLLGIIDKKHPGPDNVTRVVTLRCKNGVLKRPVSKLCILPTET